MARQSTTPVQFEMQTRTEDSVTMTSGRAGKVVPISYFPVLRGDSASGRVGANVDLAEMTRPVQNAVIANFQAWFIPKSAHPQFSGRDEFMHAYQGEQIKALGQADRDPPAFFNKIEDAPTLALADSCELFRKLGIHIVPGAPINTDLIDAFNLVYNFRLASYSSRLERRKYATEDFEEATSLPPAFWPRGRFSNVVPDYERALIVGSLDLDILSGTMPILGAGIKDGTNVSRTTDISVRESDYTENGAKTYGKSWGDEDWTHLVTEAVLENGAYRPNMRTEMAGQKIGITLADIDKARTTQAFAKLRTLYAGNDSTGFDNDDVIVAELMQGFVVPEDQFKRPWLLDSQKVAFGMSERHATDAGNLDQSVSVGRASASLSINVPKTETGGVVIVTVEVVPERLDERQADEWLHITDVADLPDALRDVQRPEPVDMVLARRLDARHTTPGALYGYEPMNDVWNRSFTRLGGDFYQEDPLNPWTEQRSAIWQTSIVDPSYTENHWVVPEDFPHDVFAVSANDAFEAVVRHAVAIRGLTQIGDVLAENNDDYEAVAIGEE